MSDNKFEPAFPTITWDQLESGQIIQQTDQNGLSKREIFAMAAMQGLLSNPEIVNRSTADNKEWREDLALTATMVTDALLNELSKA